MLPRLSADQSGSHVCSCQTFGFWVITQSWFAFVQHVHHLALLQTTGKDHQIFVLKGKKLRAAALGGSRFDR